MNLNRLITPERDSINNITGYSLPSAFIDFSDKQRVGLNLPEGSKNVKLQPYIVQKMSAADNTVEEYTFNVNTI